MANFNLQDYEPVEARLQKYMKEYPDARVITAVEHQEAERIVIKATLYKNAEEQAAGLPHATGIAEETRGEGYVNKTSHVENCETSAVGRALANAGFSGNKNGSRASREEMVKVQKPAETPRPTQDTRPATEQQVKMIFAVAHDKGLDAEQAKEKIKAFFKLESFNDLTLPEAKKAIDSLLKLATPEVKETQVNALTDEEVDEIDKQ